MISPMVGFEPVVLRTTDRHVSMGPLWLPTYSVGWLYTRFHQKFSWPLVILGLCIGPNIHGLGSGRLWPTPKGKGKGILLAITDSTHRYIYLYLWGDGRSRPALRPCMIGPMHNPNMTKGQENLLVSLANRRRVVGLTLPNFSGSMVCAPIMEYLDSI